MVIWKTVILAIACVIMVASIAQLAGTWIGSIRESRRTEKEAEQEKERREQAREAKAAEFREMHPELLIQVAHSMIRRKRNEEA